jgi:cell division protein FtsW
MIFAVIGEELGLVGAAVLIAGYAAFAYAGLRLAIGCKDPFGKRLAAGVTALICGQAAINLAAVLGLAPLTGIPLPFVSYGGSSLVIALLSVGILLNIARGNGQAKTTAVPDRSRGNGRSRRPVARSGGSTARARSGSDVRRVAGSRRGSARS